MGTSDSQFFLSFLLSCGWPNNKTKTFFRKSLRWTLHCDPPRPLKYAQQQLKIDTKHISPPLFISRKIILRIKRRRNSKFGPNYSIFTPRLSFPHYWTFFPPLGGIPFSSSAVSTKMRPIWIKGRVRKGGRKRRPGVPLKKVIDNCRFATSCVVVVSTGFVKIKETSFRQKI